MVPIGNKTIETGKTLEFDVMAVDDDGDELSFGIEGKPASADFTQVDNSTAHFAWTPIASDAGPEGRGQDYAVTFKVTDGIDTASETIIVTVTLGGAGTGAPVFISPSDHTLDLDRTSTIKFNIEVRDADSAQVDMALVQGIPGGDFQTSSGSKLASFRWTPSSEQIAERPVWGIRVSADDRSNPSVFQDITILCKGGQQKCEGTPPRLVHEELPDQRGPGDYTVSVQVTDEESAISAVALYYLYKGLGDEETFSKTAMSPSGSDRYQAVIPNPALVGEETVVVDYYICAVDDDDLEGSGCDLRACAPDEGRYSFTAYAAGSSNCEDAAFEPNDDFAHPAALDPGTYAGLKICPADEDWFLIQMPADHYLGVGIGFTQANGALRLDLLDADGTTPLASTEYETNQAVAYSDVFALPQDAYVRIRGDSSATENSYDLIAISEAQVACNDDSYEPNDTPEQAKAIAEDVYTGLTCCGDPDFYTLALLQGDRLRVTIDFDNEQGDLDLWVFDSYHIHDEMLSCENAVGCSTTETDDEQVDVPISAGGTYYVAVGPYQGAHNSYDMLVEIESAGCQDDSYEPDDTPDDANPVWPEDPIVTGRVICADDDDWYITMVSAGETLVIDLGFTHADGDLDMKLYDSSVTPETLGEHELASAYSSSDNERIEYPVLYEDLYYIRVYGYAGAENGYSIDLSVQ
ncbi:MAG: PPC domain-containing protein [Deltaproteobacteria bacterium]|nr:PPC domain-containing protein [Deltaproteobacteria bacterium]